MDCASDLRSRWRAYLEWFRTLLLIDDNLRLLRTLICAAKYLSEQYDTFDFRVSNVLGEEMLTFLYPRNRTAVILDSEFNVYKTFTTSSIDRELDNMHDLHFVDNGTRALFFYDEVRNVTSEQTAAIGFTNWNCPVRENSFREIDLTKSWESVFSW